MSNDDTTDTIPPDNQAVCNSFRQRQTNDPINIALKAALRALAVEAGDETFPVPLCGGGFTDHHIRTKTNKCVDCAAIRGRRNAEAASAEAKALKASNRNINNQQKDQSK